MGIISPPPRPASAWDWAEPLDIWPAFNGAAGGDWVATTYAQWIAGVKADLAPEIARGVVTETDRGLCSDGTNRIYSYTAGSGPFKVYLQAGLHGFEKSAQHSALRWFQQFLRSPHSSMAFLRKAVTVVWVPTASPASYNSGLRKNANNVDPNRNFAFYWNQYTVVNSDNQKGRDTNPAPMSEPETVLAKTIVDEGAVVVIDCHDAGPGDLGGADLAVAPSNAWAFSKRRLVYSAIRRCAAVYGNNIINFQAGAAGHRHDGPTCNNYTNLYNLWIKRRYEAASVTIEMERNAYGSTVGVMTTRPAIRNYCSYITQFILSWLEYGMEPPTVHPVSWQARRDTENTAVNLIAGGTMMDTAAYQGIFFDAFAPGDTTNRDFIEVTAPCEGQFEIWVRGYLESKGATARVDMDIEVNGVAQNTFNSVQVSPNNGERVDFSTSSLYRVTAIDGATTYKIRALFSKFNGVTPNPIVKRCQVFVRFVPNDDLHPVPYAPG